MNTCYRQCFFILLLIAWVGIVTAGCDPADTQPTAPAPAPAPTPTPSFSGAFRRDYTVEAIQGGTVAVTDIITLTEQNSEISGKREVIGAHACCTANYTTAIVGRVTAEREAELGWGYAEDRCETSECWHGINTNGGTWYVTLSEDGVFLYFTPEWAYVRF